MNVETGAAQRIRPVLFSPPVIAAVLLAVVALAVVAHILFGLAGLLTLLAIMLWSEFLLRVGPGSLLGRRRRDRVMAPQVLISFACHRSDPALGWANLPDQNTRNGFTIPRKHLRLEYTVNTDGDGRRVTSNEAHAGRVVSIYGCSNTFGWGLDDEATYPWLLQERLPDCTVLNYGVSGYSLYQILLRMEATIARDRPEVVVLGFSPGLEARSVNDSAYLRMISEFGGAPPSCLSVKGRNGKQRLRRFQPEAYRRLPGDGRSSLVQLAGIALNRVRFLAREGAGKKVATTRHLLLSMDNLCRSSDTVFLVQYVSTDARYQEFLSGTGVNWAAGPVDLDSCTEDGAYRYRQFPFDGHPNAAANVHYAEALEPAIREILDTGTFTRNTATRVAGREDESTASAIYPVF